MLQPTVHKNISYIFVKSLLLEDTNDNSKNVAFVMINEITRSLNIVILGGSGINNIKRFEIQLNLLFWSENCSDHKQISEF